MFPVLIFQHIAHEGPGYLSDFFHRLRIPFEVVKIDKDEPVPDSLEDVSGLVFMGGPMSVNDPLPWIAKEIRLIRQAMARDVPVLGHCLGGQLMARALGAEVRRNPVTEIGWHPAEKIDNPVTRDWLGDVGNPVELFHWHKETSDLPEGAAPLLKSAYCRNQAFVHGNGLAMQCHIEMTEDLVKKWVLESGDTLEASESVQSGEEMQRDLSARVRNLNRVADSIYSRWIKGLPAP